MSEIQFLVDRIKEGYEIEKGESLALAELPNDELSAIAGALQQLHHDRKFEFCAIINAKSGVCSENCTFCAQSGWYRTGARNYELIGGDQIFDSASLCADKGVKRFSIVTSGRKLNGREITRVCEAVRRIRDNLDIGLCASIGFVTDDDLVALKNAGVTRIHNNLETSRRYFSQICSSHSYDDKLAAIARARNHGLEICSGGIIGLGETWADRIDLALEVRGIGAVSMPINILHPIKGTPLEHAAILSQAEVEKTVALTRIINPGITIRMAGGRKLLSDNGKGCFLSGANAAITGDMLTTSGSSIDEDVRLIQSIHYEM